MFSKWTWQDIYGTISQSMFPLTLNLYIMDYLYWFFHHHQHLLHLTTMILRIRICAISIYVAWHMQLIGVFVSSFITMYASIVSCIMLAKKLLADPSCLDGSLYYKVREGKFNFCTYWSFFSFLCFQAICFLTSIYGVVFLPSLVSLCVL